MSVGPMRSRQHAGRLLLHSAWLLFSAVLVVIAGAGLVDSIANSGYDAQENRAPEARIIVAAIATVLALAGIGVILQRLRRQQALLGPVGALLLTAATVVWIGLFWVVEILTGPL
jgi:hydrogenase-4 membrane subunit HyfE